MVFGNQVQFPRRKICICRRPVGCRRRIRTGRCPVQVLAENHFRIRNVKVIARAIPDNHVAGGFALRVVQFGLARQRHRFIRHAILDIISINRLFARHVIGLAFVICEIYDHIRLGDNVGHAPA